MYNSQLTSSCKGLPGTLTPPTNNEEQSMEHPGIGQRRRLPVHDSLGNDKLGQTGLYHSSWGSGSNINNRDENAAPVLIAKDKKDMLKLSEESALGTLVFLTDEEALLVRIGNGWRYVSFGSHVAPPSVAAPPLATVLNTEGGKPSSPEVNSIRSELAGPKLRLAALNDPIAGNMHGVRGADFSCYRQARRVGLRGTFRALLTSHVQNLDTIVRSSDRNLPVVNLRGEMLFKSWNDVFSGSGGTFSQKPRIFSFDGKDLLKDATWPQKYVWHGSDVVGERSRTGYCNAWNTASGKAIGLASDLLKNSLLGQEHLRCNNSIAVLCIEATSQTRFQRSLYTTP
ncbi:collagen alpha-1(XV) chain-like isoform X2 [Penaeus japonicus]|uniref:collagen alpha-1(XV) chain-like isoform X2 n=1 Tax=Penaeus japonicus TaxID=27405 RepID=UPI001C7174D4|nr:collagen alpha-1(XV) chain-like isoform X2 [Penaeus japonicus]